MKEFNDKIQELDREDLDTVVGGVFNQNFIQQNNLQVFTGKSGAQGLRVRIHSSDPLVRAVMGHDVSFMGTSSETTLLAVPITDHLFNISKGNRARHITFDGRIFSR